MLDRMTPLPPYVWVVNGHSEQITVVVSACRPLYMTGGLRGEASMQQLVGPELATAVKSPCPLLATRA
jgi:hypothetical protein